jgi:hypothetical protein
MPRKKGVAEIKSIQLQISMYPWQRAQLDIAANNAKMYLGPYLVETALAAARDNKEVKK